MRPRGSPHMITGVTGSPGNILGQLSWRGYVVSAWAHLAETPDSRRDKEWL